MEKNQYVIHLLKESGSELFYPIEQECVNQRVIGHIVQNHVKISTIELLVALCNNPRQLLFFAQHPQTSFRALTEIVSHQRNTVCWAAVARHKNVTTFHLELIMEYPLGIHWFETECTIARCPRITRQIIEELLRRNPLIPNYAPSHSLPRSLWKQKRIIDFLLGNPAVPLVYRNECHHLLQYQCRDTEMTA